MSDLEPITRKEQYLNRLTGEEQAIPETPVTRIEQYLAKLCGVETEIPSSPITREETYLAYLNGEDVTLPEPITRLERFMAFAAGESETKPTPLTREEYYWDKYQGGVVLKDFPGLPASIVTVTDALAKPLDSLKVAITPVQSGSGDPSPDNIRPISGWTECNVTKTGSCIFGGLPFAQAFRGKAYGYSIDTTAKTFRFSRSVSTNHLKITDLPRTSNGQMSIVITYSISGNASNSCLEWTYTDGTVDYFTLDTTGGEKVTVTKRINANKIANTLSLFWRTTGTVTCYYEETGIFPNQTTSASMFEPYTGQDYPITFPTEAGTVYGGTLDVVNGTLTVNKTKIRLNDYLDDVGIVGSGSKRYFRIDGIVFPEYYRLCEKIKNAQIYSTTYDIGIGMGTPSGTSGYRLSVRPPQVSGMTVEEFRDYINGMGDVYVVVSKTPITYQLTPTEITMLLGTNNIWADTGDIMEGKYWSKNPVTVTRAMLNTLRSAGEITEITPTEEPEETEENDER